MKKLYTFAVALFATSSLFAAVPKDLTIHHMPAEMQAAFIKAGIFQKETVNESAWQEFKAPEGNGATHVAPQKALTFDSNWEDLGEGKFVNTVPGIFGGNTEKISVPAQKAESISGGSYRFVEPFANSDMSSIIENVSGAALTFSISGTRATISEEVTLFKFTGDYAGYGNVALTDIGSYYTKNGYTATDDYYATYTAADGTIVFPENVLLVYISGYGKYYYAPSGTRFILPGGKDYETSVDVPTCASGTFEVGCSLNEYVKSAKFLFFDGYYEASDDVYDYVASQNVTALEENITGTIDPSEYGIDYHTPLTFFLVGLDESGNRVCGSVGHTFYQPEESAQWASIGTGKYSDGFIVGYYGSMANTDEVEVKIEENRTTPGYFRLVNPFDALYPEYLEGGHDHYMYINATDEEKVYIEPSSFGFDFGDGMIFGCSYSYFYAFYGEEIPEDYAGVWDKDEKEIVFPTYYLQTAEANYNNGSFASTNSKGTFKVTLPENYNGVKDIVANSENAPDEYFNLQGVRISNPEAGQLVIRRQGNNVTKSVVK